MFRTILVSAAFSVIAGAAASASVLGGIAAVGAIGRPDNPSLTSSVASDGYAIGGRQVALAGYGIGGHPLASDGYGIGGLL